MTDTTEAVVETPVSDANASQPDDAAADALANEAGSEAESSPAADETTGEQPKALDDLRQRVNKVTRNWRETERERDYWREQALKGAKPADPEPPKPEPVERVEPLKTEADFDYDPVRWAEYQRSVISAEARREAARLIAEERTKEQQTKLLSEDAARREAFKKSAPDFDDVIASATINQQMSEILFRHEDGPAMAYHLGQHPDVSAAIAKLPPAQAAFEMGLIAAELRARRAPAKAPPPPIPKAPPPPPKLDAGDATPPVRTTDPSGDRLSDDEWARLERKRLSRKRGT